MVSSFSNPGFPPVHAHPTRLPAMDASLSAAIDSFEASMRSMRASFREAIYSALAPIRHELSLLRRDLALAAGGVSDPAPTISDDTESIDLGHPGLQGDDNPLRIPSPIEVHSIPPLLSSSPLLQAMATSAIRPQLTASSAARVPKMATVVQLLPVGNASIFKPHTTDPVATTATIPLLDLEKVMPVAASVQSLGVPLRNANATESTGLSQLADQETNTNTTKHRHEVLRSLIYNFSIGKAKWHWLLQFILAYYLSVILVVYDVLLTEINGWVNWYLVGKFVKKNFCALQLFDRLSKRGSANVHVLSVASLDMHDLEASTKLDGSSSTPMVKEVSSEKEANVSHTEIKITEYHGSDSNCDLSEKSNNDSVESGDCASPIRDDGYLLFKRLCKMSMKYSSDEHFDDQILLRGIVLSLELLQVVIDDRGPIRCNNVTFLNAVKQLLFLSLLHISALSVMAIFEPLSSSSNEKLLFDRCPKTENVRAHVVQSLNGDLPASTVGKSAVTVHNSVSSLSSPFSRDLKRLQGGAAVRSVLQLLSNGYWDELFQFINVEFDHVKGMENLGVRWMTLPTASLLILLFDGMSKRHNYNWNSHSCSYAVWNAPMLCGSHKLMHHLVLQIHDHDWHPIGDTKSIKVEVKMSVGISHGGYIILWWLLWRMKAIGITTSFAKAPMEFVSPVELQLRMACILFYSWAALFVTDQAIHDRIKGIITSMNAQIPYFKKIFSMIANRLTRFLNLKIEVNLPLTKDGTTIASILFLLIHGMLFKELLWLAEMKQYCDDANLSDASPLNPKKSLIAQTLYFLEVTSRVADNHNNSGKHCDGEDSAVWFHSNTIYTVDIYPLFENAGLFESHIQQHGAAASAIERKSLINQQQNKRVNYKKQTRGHFVVKLSTKEIVAAIKFPDAMEIADAIDKVEPDGILSIESSSLWDRGKAMVTGIVIAKGLNSFSHCCCYWGSRRLSLEGPELIVRDNLHTSHDGEKFFPAETSRLHWESSPKLVLFFQHLGWVADINQGFCSPSFGAVPWSDNKSREAYDEFTAKKFQISSANPNLEDKVVFQGGSNDMICN